VLRRQPPNAIVADFFGADDHHAMSEPTMAAVLACAAAILAALLLSLALNVVLRPWFVRYALARPNARSSHSRPTPQGGGMAVVVATLLAAWSAVLLVPAISTPLMPFVVLSSAALLLAAVGAVDDIRNLPAAPRFLLQSLAAAAVLMTLPHDVRIVPLLPEWLERAALFIGLVWFVNLVNFMDGIDWMTVAEVVPITAAIVIVGLSGAVADLPTLVAAALLGATLGFAPFNKPVAKLFLGDVGSLPMGLMLGWLLIVLAGNGHWAAALLLPLYYLVDATVTLLRRIAAREPFWQAHRTHFYQRATDRGFTVPQIVVRVFVVNLALAALAFVTVWSGRADVSMAMLALGLAIVAALLATFARGPR
jgi:UDP-N-acetylmuramyl pentapeptide phosphotransferase/UDP-N-acetylglucosamine-1-phosphate transferase